MSNYIRDMIRNYVEVNNELNNVFSSLLEDSSSSGDDEPVPRPMFDRSYKGHHYVVDVLSEHPVHSYQCFRLPSQAFIQLRDLLISRGLLRDS